VTGSVAQEVASKTKQTSGGILGKFFQGMSTPKKGEQQNAVSKT
jgi:hypothetical protein